MRACLSYHKHSNAVEIFGELILDLEYCTINAYDSLETVYRKMMGHGQQFRLTDLHVLGPKATIS